MKKLVKSSGGNALRYCGYCPFWKEVLDKYSLKKKETKAKCHYFQRLGNKKKKKRKNEAN